MTTLFYEQNIIAKTLLYLLIILPFTGSSQQTAGTNTGTFCEASTTWNGTSWSNGAPQAGKDVIFSADYTFSGVTVNACSVTVLDGVHVTFTSNSNAIIVHSINVAPTGEMVFDSGSNLIQTEADENTGNVIIKRNSSLIKKDAFTLWSSPVSGQVLLDFSPETLLNRFYSFSTIDNIYSQVASPATTAFEKAKSYLIRTGENHPVTPAVWEGRFEGVPNTGHITLPLSFSNNNDSYNAVGNPYPSPISITKFFDANDDVIENTLWLWRKTDNTSMSSYSVVTRFGYQSNTIPDPTNTTIQNPYDLYEEGILNTAQGFLVRALNSNQELVFDNDMRVPVSSQAFFRTATAKKDGDEIDASRFWLNITAENIFSQALVGYSDIASSGYDSGWDGEAMMDGTTTLYSIADDKKLAIQARPEFESSDIVTLGLKTATACSYTIKLDHVDGLFAEGQHIYLKDADTNTIHDLTNGGYVFTSAAGIFENRFTVGYSSTMGTEQPVAGQKGVVVFSNNHQIKVQSAYEIANIAVYDITGRRILAQDNINAQEFASDVISVQAPLIVKITLDNGTVVSKKIIVQ